MRAGIATSKDDPSRRWIIDANSYASLTGPYKKEFPHYLTAIRIDLEPPGAVRGASIPRFEVFALLRSDAVKTDEFSKTQHCIMGFHRSAAEVLLKLAAAHQNITTTPATKSFAFAGKPIMEAAGCDSVIAWSEWKLITAWRWSEWRNREIAEQRKITLKERHTEMVEQEKYPHAQKAFERMHRELFPKPTN